jgi:hypothetical protein
MKITLSQISIENYSQYSRNKNIEGNYYNDLNWLKIYGNDIEIVGIFDEGKNILGHFFLYLGTSLGQPFGITPPYTQDIGLTFNHSATNKATINSLFKQLHEEIAIYLIYKKLVLFNIVFPTQFFDAQPYLWNDCEASLKYSYHIDLNQSIETIESNFSSERRKNISKAKKDGLEARLSYNFPLLYEMTFTTLALKKADSNSEILRNLFFDYATEENAFGFITYKDNKPSAMVFMLKDVQATYYLFGSYDKENQHEGAGALAMYSAIEHAKKLGLSTFDFSGSMIPSVEKYFRGFGGDLIPMMQIVKASKKGKILLRLRRRKITK